MHADHLLHPWLDALLEVVPGLTPFDAHTHTGSNDPDGYRLSADDLTHALELIAARAAVFTMHEPDGYRDANDRVLAEAAASGGRLVPFCRLDPHADAVAEAERCLDAGARGIKLHPRAERFRLEEPETEPIFRLADERRVPVVVHAGRGIPALGRDAIDLARRFPGARIVLAHAAVSDLAWIWRHAQGLPNLLFDSSWWSAVDLLTLFALVPPGQVLFASDAPYGTPLQSAILTLRCALQAGVEPGALRLVMGGQMERLVAGEDPVDLGPAPGGPTQPRDLVLERAHDYLTTAIGRMLLSEPADEYLDLARLACQVGDDAPQGPAARSILALLERFDEHVAATPQLRDLELGAQRFPGLHLVVVAATIALTPGVALPPEPEPVAADERSA